MQSAGRHAGQALAVLGDEAHDFALALLGGIAQGGLPAHLPAVRFQGQGEMQNAQPLFGKCRGRVVLASRDLATSSHGPEAQHDK